MKGKINLDTVKAILGSMSTAPMFINREHALSLVMRFNAMMVSGTLINERKVEVDINNKASLVDFKSNDKNIIIGSNSFAFKSAPPETIAMIPVKGAMMLESYATGDCEFVQGTKDLGRTILALDKNPNIDGVIFEINTPGGQARGNESLSNIVKAFSKPSIGLFDGMASAGVYAFQGVDKLYATEKEAYWGSIGTYQTFMDDRAFWESAGIEWVDIYASQSTHKNKDYRDALDGDFDAIQETLDRMTNIFIKDVKNSRPGIKDDGKVFKGQLYNAVEAKKIGAIDGIKTLDAVIKEIASMSKKHKRLSSKTNNQIKSNTNNMANKTFFQKLFGDDSTEEEATNQLEKVAEEKKTMKASIVSMEEEIAKNSEEAIASTEKIEALDKEVADLKLALAQSEEKNKASNDNLSALESTEFDTVQALVDDHEKVMNHNKEIAAATPAATPLSTTQVTSHKQEGKVIPRARTYDEVVAAMTGPKDKK